MKIETIPCKICDRPTTFIYTELCDSCWHVEQGLSQYLSTEKGRKAIKRRLRRIKYEN